MSNVLVAYFSASGTTASVAAKVAAANADIYVIEPTAPYTNADLNWMDKKSRSSIEMGDKSFRPPMVKKELRTENYDMILIGSRNCNSLI